MASQEIRNRQSINTPPSSWDETKRLMNTTSPMGRTNIQLLCPFSFPPGPEAAVVRIVHNIAYFWLFYTLVMWVGLSISLIPERKLSLLLLIATSAVTSSYLLLLRLLPSSSIVHRVIDRRLVVMLMVIVTVIELILTDAGIHLGLSMAIGIPVVVVHAMLRSRDDLFLNDEARNPGELFFLVEKKPTEESVMSTVEV